VWTVVAEDQKVSAPETVLGSESSDSEAPLASWSMTLSFAERLLDHLEAAVIATDLTGRIHYANPFAATLYVRPVSKLLGAESAQFAADAVTPDLAREIGDALKERQSWTGDF